MDPSAVLAGVLCGGYLEGEDLPEGTSCSVAVQPELVHSSLTSCGSEAFGLHARGVVPQAHQRVRYPLHKRRGAAHEGERILARGPGYLRERLCVDAPVVAAPAFRPRAGQGVDHLQRTVSCDYIFQLLAVDDLLE